MALVLAVESDPKQAAVLKQIVRDRVGAQFVHADSKDAALAAIAERVPDLILVTALLSPRDESELTDRLRDLEGAEHLQTLTIPLLAVGTSAAPEPKKKRRGLLSAFSGESGAPAVPSGCDPAVFADEIRNYLARADDLKLTAAAERERKRTPRRKKAEPPPREAPSALIRDVPVEAPLPEQTTSGPVSGPQGSYWAWEPSGSSAPVEPARPAKAESSQAKEPGAPLEGGHSSWANPWDVSRTPAPAPPLDPEVLVESGAQGSAESAPIAEAPPPPDQSSAWSDQARAALEGLASQSTYLDDHELPTALDPLPVVTTSAADALLEQPSAPSAAELVAEQPAAIDEEVDLSGLLDATGGNSARAESTATDIYTLSDDAIDLQALLGRAEPAAGAAIGADAPPAVSDSDREALEALQADVNRLRADRESVERALADARAGQERAEAAAEEAARRAREQAAQHAEELAAHARREAAAERKARERDEQKAREEAEQRAEAEHQARLEFERLTREVEARMREEAEAERRLREQAERAVADAEAARVRERAERQAHEDAERKARAEAEASALSERRAREQAEARAESERKAREAVELKARLETERVAREAEERRAREAAELKAREDAERKARRDAEARAEAERLAREDAERKAREHAERVAREAEARRLREAAELKAREEAERKARREAEAAAAAERKAREESERRVREEAEARVEAERKARKEAERQARLEAEKRADMERRARQEAERLAGEAATRAREEAKAERKAREQAERRAAEERKARELAERKAREEALRRAAAEARARQEAERRAAEEARPKKARIVKKARSKPAPAPARERKPGQDPTRPTQDEWGMYDPDKAGFGALYARLEAIETDDVPEEDPSAADLLARDAGPSRAPRPLSMWAWRHAAGTGEPAKGESPADDFRELVDRLRLPAAVAAVGYARGARIRRVKISRAAKPARAKHEDTPIIILSRKMLKAVRAESAAPPALTARR